ncbi:hypothetical protein [Streptomyces cavernicola]|uniref:Secreted protein n=1 Tax=Streptomyces cavernicola TaxID=3043613 RepID=A0ABT6SE45_9ACTN|nr:hypothetical protein [Streptomyces sp. B-S-A6]MDI3405566.1 hypothetical protein [Streptomyces sp. B-S-A6]
MRSRALLISLAAAASTLGMVAPAQAADAGDVVVFSTEFQPLDTYENPQGCHKLPLAAHTLTNRTDKPVTVHADPFCVTPGLTIMPGYGSHVAPGTGSFSV